MNFSIEALLEQGFSAWVLGRAGPAVQFAVTRWLLARRQSTCTGADMAGLTEKRGTIDKLRLDLSERQAVEYWMKRWGVTRDQLVAAHRKAGRLVKDIAAELGKKR